VSAFITTNAGKENEEKKPRGQLPLVRILDEDGEPTDMFHVHLSHFRDDEDGNPVLGVEVFTGINGYLDAVKDATENLGDCEAEEGDFEAALMENALAKAKASVKKQMEAYKKGKSDEGEDDSNES
tara:strand:- start:636 stop:1013 length:378 start_codon:yes stop_codon:yes gene_type:complete